MTVLGVYSIKGGVGKTATSVNLAWLAARDGEKSLLVDLDPQAAATYHLRVKPKLPGGGKKLVRGGWKPEKGIKGSDYEHLDLLPAQFSHRHLDLALFALKKPERRLAKLLAPLAEEYRWVFLDCAPSISLTSESVFHASDALVVPTIPTPLSLRTLTQLHRHLKKSGPKELPVLPFFCMVDRRKALHRSSDEFRLESPFPVLSAEIPYASDVEKMGIERRPLPVYAPTAPASRAYEALWREVRERVAETGKERG